MCAGMEDAGAKKAYLVPYLPVIPTSGIQLALDSFFHFMSPGLWTQKKDLLLVRFVILSLCGC